MTYKTEQEAFWAGSFGNEYIDRNLGDELLSCNRAFFERSLRAAKGIRSVVEFGANVGMNLRALKLLNPAQEQYGVEINSLAAESLREAIPPSHVYEQSLLDFDPPRTWDLVLIKTVLIHINPEHLPRVYDSLYRSSSRFIMVAEYYNPTPVEVSYRGHQQRLFKRDFAGEMLAAFPDLRLVDYGFVYRQDPVMSQDDITWFLLEKATRSTT
jgi:pseudaminic acid biosynthesis-associated methylase